MKCLKATKLSMNIIRHGLALGHWPLAVGHAT